jgi:choline kinase
MRLIILAAGQGFKLDGFNKILLKDPKTRKTILDYYIEYFSDHKITMVVGYKSITIMNEYPQIEYIFNEEWRLKGNSHSLALALNEEPCIVLPSDLFFDKNLAELIKKAPKNMGLVDNTENRSSQALNCHVENKKIKNIYGGKPKMNDPELMGVFKVTNKEILRKWKRNCLKFDNIFIGKNLPIKEFDIYAVEKREHLLYEINTPSDYINFINLRKIM